MKNKQIRRIFIISIVLIMFLGIKNIYAEGTLRMQITSDGAAWTNINISESYEMCENLNKSTSTLGTNLLKAHLTTDEDWSAMAIFSVSQYGAATNNLPGTTTNNLSGIYNVGKNNTQSTGLALGTTASTNSYVSGLFNEDGSLKKYIKTWDLNNISNSGFVGFRENNGTYGWMGSVKQLSTNANSPVSIHSGLFGVILGYYSNGVTVGVPFAGVTFRPVIWN